MGADPHQHTRSSARRTSNCSTTHDVLQLPDVTQRRRSARVVEAVTKPSMHTTTSQSEATDLGHFKGH